jgi:pectate lyase
VIIFHTPQGYRWVRIARDLADLTRTILTNAVLLAITTSGVMLCTASNAQAQLPAFPGAQGGGAAAEGGRGGRVIEVTSLSDSGPGTLRACLREAVGPRLCVFRVAGTIELESTIQIDNPYVTIAGQTAPGGGILINGRRMAADLIGFNTHDVIWRYTRLRTGYNGGPSGTGTALQFYEGSHDIIIDHLSISWTPDDAISVWSTSSKPINNLTLSWNLTAETLSPHATGYIVASGSSTQAGNMTDIDFHHNLLMSNDHRVPLLKNRSSRLINNIFYNNQYQYTQMGGGINADIIGNIYKRGPLDVPDTSENRVEIRVFTGDGANGAVANGNPSIYVQGNIGWNQSDPTGDPWRMTTMETREDGVDNGAIPDSYLRSGPLPSGFAPIAADPANTLEGLLLPTVGASQRLDCSGRWIDNRDSVDARLVDEYQSNHGTSVQIKHHDDIGGFPTLAGGSACTDTDRDGMPNAYELSHGLKYYDASDANLDSNGNGITNIEEYLAGSAATPVPTSGSTGRVRRSRISSTSTASATRIPAGGTSACVQYSLKGVEIDNNEGGYIYHFTGPLGINTPPDNTNNRTQSALRLFENGRELGPAHTEHAEIRSLGAGRFSHWSLTDGQFESVRFSSSDNSDPRSNGRAYSFCIPQ